MFPESLINYGAILRVLGHSDSAIAVMRHAVELEQRDPWSGDLGALGFTLAASGRAEEALAVKRELEQRARSGYVSPAAIALIELGLGHRDQAVAGLARAINAKNAFVVSIFPGDRMFDGLRADRRFADLKRRG